MKTGDKVYTIERSPLFPNGEYRWLSTITKIESNYIETEYYRTEEDWLMKIINEQISKGDLRTAHRTFLKQIVKNYNDTITNNPSVVPLT